MKRIALLSFTLVLLLTLAACGGKAMPAQEGEPRSSPAAGPTETEESKLSDRKPRSADASDISPLAERLEGVYRSYDDPEADEHRIQVFSIGGTLLIDNQLLIDDCLYSFWFQELRPETADALSGSADAVSAPNLAFSVMSGDGYWQPVNDVTVALTENGLTVTETPEGGSSTRVFERVENMDTFHEISEEDRRSFGLEKAASLGDGLLGDWCYTDSSSAVWISLRDDGTILSALKRCGEPIRVSMGAWGIDSNGHLTVLAQRPETGTMPYLWRLEWEHSGEDIRLNIIESDDELLPDQGMCTLSPAPEDWRIPEGLYG